MKRRFLKLNKPCNEKWENMKPNETGSFCDLCSKNVIDFSQKNQLEISDIIKKSNGNICARVTQKQLSTPLFDYEIQKKYSLPYSNITTSLMIAATLTTGQTLHAETTKVQTEFVQTTSSVLKSEKKYSKSKLNNTKPNTFTTLKGKVNSEINGKPIENAEITFVTVKKTLATYTLENGTFSLEIPTHLIDNDNVIRISYNEVKRQNDKEEYIAGYETNDYILTKEEINSDYEIKAMPMLLIPGGISYYYEEGIPIVISNGEEIKYKDFIKAQRGATNSCNLENKEYYYFEPKAAIAI